LISATLAVAVIAAWVVLGPGRTNAVALMGWDALYPASGGATSARVTSGTVRTIPAGFVGLSMETDGLTTAGGPPGPFDPVLAQLIRNLSPSARPVLRIGGESTDYSWWPVAKMPRPRGIHYALTPAWLGEVRDLARATDARLIVGINLKSASRRVAATEASALVTGIGSRSILGLEPGNEPELYRTLPPLNRSRPEQSTAQRVAAFGRLFAAVTDRLPGGALAGPSIGSDKWLPYLGSFLRHNPRVRLATVHRYPLKHCERTTTNSISALLSDASSRGLALSLRASVRVVHASGRALRLDEFNSVSCGGEAGVSDTFASALWALNTSFEMLRVGVDGINVHTRPLSLSQLFNLSRTGSTWRAAIRPEYYGLLAFAMTAPAGSRLLRVIQPATAGVHVWATRTGSGTEHVVVINATQRRHALAVTLPARGPFTATVLRARALGATSGVTLGGQSFDPVTTTGLLGGTHRASAAAPVKGRIELHLAPATAVLLQGPG
jgi:hypothetical protein